MHALFSIGPASAVAFRLLGSYSHPGGVAPVEFRGSEGRAIASGRAVLMFSPSNAWHSWHWSPCGRQYYLNYPASRERASLRSVAPAPFL